MHRPAALLLLVALALPGPAPAAEVDLDALGRIRDEGFHRSEVDTLARHLTDAIGPRLTGSPAMRAANEWTRDRFAAWGLAEPRLEPWEFGAAGWSFARAEVRMVAPSTAVLFGLPKAWTLGTAGPVRGRVKLAKLEAETDVEALRGQVAGKILLVVQTPDPLESDREPEIERYDPEELVELAEYDVPAGRDPEARRRRMRERYKLWRAANELFAAEGALATVEASSFRHGAVRVAGGGGFGLPDEPRGVPGVVIAREQYQRLQRLVEDGTPVELEILVETTDHPEATTAWNTLADLPGADSKGEFVMVGAHLDSWHAGTGATDNAAGSAVVLEVARILRALGRTPRRTIRFALWSGEEQGLLGSRAYVEHHFATRPEPTDAEELALPERYRRETWPLTAKPEHARLAAYFNLDNGSGRIRGLYAQENLGAKLLFERWLAPLADLGVGTVTMENTRGTDHLSFDRVGLPGFQFVQDQLDYSTRTHHSHLDTYDHLVREDLMQAAVVMASVVWQAANEPGSLPRKPMPRPPPAQAAPKSGPDGGR